MLLLHRHLLPLLCALPSNAIGCAALAAQAPRAAPAPLAEPAPDSRALPREVFVLVASTDEDLEARRPDVAHTLLQMPLNHLGLRLVEHGIDDGQPPDLDPARVLAVATWFLGDEQLPEWVWPWLMRQPRALRVLHLGSLRPLSRDDNGVRTRAWLQRFGLGYDAREVGEPDRVRVEFPRPELYPFESRPVYERAHVGPWLRDPTNRAWVLTHEAGERRQRRAPVVTGPWGGVALQPWLLRIGGAARDRRWYVEPFEFLREALGLRGLPVPDPCVRNGRRMFLLHVDGDGFESRSAVVPGQLCGEVFRDRVIDRWRVPMTVSFIVASLTDRLDVAQPTPRMELARTILARPWVEPASHSVLHPLNWRRRLDPRALPRAVVWYPALDGYEHSMVAEVRESIAFVDRWLVPEGERCRVMLWSGGANPTEAALRAAAAAGCQNLNGGLFRCDALHDSVGFVSPWGKRIGGQFQVFAGAANENEFPGFFTTMPGAFGHVDATIERTGSPRILKPANVYVHFYSAEHPARLQALEQLLERWVEREPTIPVHASTYAAAVQDAQHRCRVVPLQAGAGYRLSGFVHCRTVRFDDPVPAIDWQRSEGLLGECTIGAARYVHLGAADAVLRFAARRVPWPHLEQASCEVADLVSTRRELRCRLPAPAGAARPRVLVVADLPPDADVRWSGGGVEHRTRSDDAGRVRLVVPAGELGEVRVWAP